MLLLASKNDKLMNPKEAAFFNINQKNKNKILSEAKDPFFINNIFGIRDMIISQKAQISYIDGDHAELTESDFQKIVLPALKK